MSAIIVSSESHVDHGLSEAQLAWVLVEAAKEHVASERAFWPAVLIWTGELPRELGTAASALHGPFGTGAKVPEGEVVYRRRGTRACASRMVDRPLNVTPYVTAIVINGELATAYSGPCAPREPWDPSIQDDPKALAESHAFWRDHALSLAGM